MYEKKDLSYYVWTAYEGTLGVHGAAKYGGLKVSKERFEEIWNEARRRGYKLHPDYQNPKGTPMGPPPDYPGDWVIVDDIGRLIASFWIREEPGKVKWR